MEIELNMGPDGKVDFGRFRRILQDMSGKDGVSKAYLSREKTDSAFPYVVGSRAAGEELRSVHKIP